MAAPILPVQKESTSSDLLLLGSSSKAEVETSITRDELQMEKPLGADNNKSRTPNVITIPPVKTNPGQTVNESKDQSQNSNSLDIGMIVGITVGVLVACVLGYLVINKNVNRPDYSDKDLDAFSQSALDNETYSRSSPSIENDYDRTSGAFNPFAPPPTAHDMLSSRSDSYRGAPAQNQTSIPFGPPVMNLGSKRDQNTLPDTNMSTASRLQSEKEFIPFVPPVNQFQAEETSYTIDRSPIRDLGHLSGNADDDMNKTTYSMFLQNESRSFDDLHVASDDEFDKEEDQDENIEINPAHLSLGTILSEGSSDHEIIGMKYRNLDGNLGLHPISESSIITSMNYQSIYSATDSNMAVYSLAEQAKRAAGTEGFQRDNMYESIRF